MKKKYLISLLCCLPWFSHANETAPSSVEVKAGYFFFFPNSDMSDVYDNGGLDLQASGAYGFCHWMRLYGSVEYLQKSGYSLNGHQSTSIWEVPLSVGLQPIVTFFSDCCCCREISGYFTLGPRYVFAHVVNDSRYVDRTMSQNGIGGFVNVGLLFLSNSHLVLDLFGEYSYCKLSFHSSHVNAEGHRVQVGGLTFGGGIGYQF